MLEKRRGREVPELTARVVAAAFPKGTLAVWLRDALGEVFSDELFAQAFPADGRPAVSPGALAAVSVLQYAENLPDRRAAEAVRARMDWKYLIGAELTDPGFDHSVLSDFRARLTGHGMEEKILEAVLQVAVSRGLLRPRGRQRTDSTKILADVRLLNRMEFAGETVRTALEALAVAHPSWLQEVLAGQEERWLDRYAERIDSWHGQLPGTDREQWLRQAGQDGLFLLEKVEDAHAPGWLRLIPAVAALRRCWDEQYLCDEHGVHPREGAQLPPGAQRAATPHDLDARYGAKRGQGWVGYALHVTETCDPDAPRLITDVATATAADGDDSAALPGIHQRLDIAACCPPSICSTAATSPPRPWSRPPTPVVSSWPAPPAPSPRARPKAVSPIRTSSSTTRRAPPCVPAGGGASPGSRPTPPGAFPSSRYASPPPAAVSARCGSAAPRPTIPSGDGR